MKWLKRDKYKVNKSQTQKICEIGLSKLYRFSDNDTYICACSTIDNKDNLNERSLIIFNSNHNLSNKDFEIDEITTISDIKNIEKSRFAIEILDLPKIYDRTEYRMDKYLSTIVRKQNSDEKIEINPKNLSEHFLIPSTENGIRIIYGTINKILLENVIDFKKQTESLETQFIVEKEFISEIQNLILYNASSTMGAAKIRFRDMIRAIIFGKGLIIKETGREIKTIDEYKEWKKDIEHFNHFNTNEIIKDIKRHANNVQN